MLQPDTCLCSQTCLTCHKTKVAWSGIFQVWHIWSSLLYFSSFKTKMLVISVTFLCEPKLPDVADASGAHNTAPWATSGFSHSCSGKFHGSPGSLHSQHPIPGMLYTPFFFEPWAFWWYLWLPYKFNLEVGGSLHIPGAVLSQWGEWGEKLVDGWPSPHPSSGTFGEAFCMLLRRTPPSMEGEPRACSNDLDNAPYVSSSSFPVSSTLLQTTGSWVVSQINDLPHVYASGSTFKTHPSSHCRNLVQPPSDGHWAFADISMDDRSSYFLS